MKLLTKAEMEKMTVREIDAKIRELRALVAKMKLEEAKTVDAQ
jgi:hypothetical protein